MTLSPARPGSNASFGEAQGGSDTDTALALLRSQSLTTLVQEKIERMILDGELAPGQRINEMALAAALGLSRSPIREACRKLEQAGMIEIINNRGMFVRKVDLRQALDIYEIRGALAQLAGELLARNATESDLAALRAKVEAMALSADRADATAYFRQNLDFHRALVVATHNPRLAEMFLGTDKELHLYRQRSLVQTTGMSASNQEHADIVEAIARRNEAAAGATFRAHVLNGRDRAIEAAAAAGDVVS